jgi:hypothetical protein
MQCYKNLIADNAADCFHLQISYMRYKKFAGGRYLGLSHFLGTPVINPALGAGHLINSYNVLHKSSQLPLGSTVHLRKLYNRITRSVNMKGDLCHTK